MARTRTGRIHSSSFDPILRKILRKSLVLDLGKEYLSGQMG